MRAAVVRRRPCVSWSWIFIRFTASMMDSLIKWCTSAVRSFFSMFVRTHGRQLTFQQAGARVELKKTILGEGGFSTVYEAKDPEGNEYAVKKVLVQSEELQRMVRTEIKASRQFDHPNIVCMIDWFETRNERNQQVFFLLFPLLKKGTLRDDINASLKTDPLRERKDVARVLEGFQSILEALHYMHTYQPKYVHQDIKPENVLIAEDGSAKLGDLGSVTSAEVHIDSRAKALQVAEQAAQASTMPYRALELFDPPTGAHLDTRSDVWGAGCLLYCWWFGYSPFEMEFGANGQAKVVECSQSRVLAKLPRPPKPSANDLFILELAEFMLVHDFLLRPFALDVLHRLKQVQVKDNVASMGSAV